MYLRLLLATVFLAASPVFAAQGNHCELVQHLRINLDYDSGRTLADRLDSFGTLRGC
jgi:hypothetical protein